MRIGRFIPCYIDAFFPEVGIATLEPLERFGPRCRLTDYKRWKLVRRDAAALAAARAVDCRRRATGKEC
jgi:hypothetical protein